MINILRNTQPMLIFTLAISTTSLASAYTAQYVFGLLPCILCLYQRIPFAIIIFFSLIGVLKAKSHDLGQALIGINMIAFLANSALALYHSGVERHWWKSIFEGCAIPDLGDDPEKILETILSSPSVPCDEIPWADPILGLSMANYNAALCFGMFILCLISLKLSSRPKHS